MIIQLLIVIFTCSSIYFISSKKYILGFTLGLCGQPFWIYTSFTNEQWGVFIVSIWFSLNHIKGIYNHRKIKGENNGNC